MTEDYWPLLEEKDKDDIIRGLGGNWRTDYAKGREWLLKNKNKIIHVYEGRNVNDIYCLNRFASWTGGYVYFCKHKKLNNCRCHPHDPVPNCNLRKIKPKSYTPNRDKHYLANMPSEEFRKRCDGIYEGETLDPVHEKEWQKYTYEQDVKLAYSDHAESIKQLRIDRHERS